jgi:hypothetical protein
MKDSLRRLSLVLALACFGSLGVACVGTMEPLAPGTGGDDTGGDDPGGGGQSLQKFDAEVKGLMKLRCAGCHTGTTPVVGPVFLGTDESTYYAKIISHTPALLDPANPAASFIAAYQHKTQTGTAFDAAEQAKVVEWVMVELAEKAQ